VKAAAAASQRLVSKVAVECNDGHSICQGVLDEGLIIFSFDARLASPYHTVAPSVQKQYDRFDHVLVREKG